MRLRVLRFRFAALRLRGFGWVGGRLILGVRPPLWVVALSGGLKPTLRFFLIAGCGCPWTGSGRTVFLFWGFVGGVRPLFGVVASIGGLPVG